MKRDEAIQWIRDVRGVISRELRNDPRQFVEFHKKLRSKYKRMSEPVPIHLTGIPLRSIPAGDGIVRRRRKDTSR
jgi:hypothetical protein